MNTTSSRRPKHLPFEVDATQQQPLGMPAERFLRDAQSLRVVEGTSNIQKTIIAGMALGDTPNR